jgi:hypothetical protein
LSKHFHQGIFKPKHPEKYHGDVNNIIYRSGWERMAMKWFDENTSVVKWCSEELPIPYICPTDNRVHRYFVDFVVKVRNTSGVEQIFLVEVKPEAQTREPPKPKRTTQKYLTETLMYVKNCAKWAAAEEYAAKRGWQFIKLTEYDLGIRKRKNG